ncbi:cytochrome c maturation protein CcmE [Rickettsia typhi]|uniref:Cytochrome c-type biogenesis protein CcmE n=2 Tax=Rickettsia typhi TaxID=785 RepID=CCME_RICTY|nr:cytochrome c maturation protein CcmE [Rickettsia typhi]Q68WF0.1 RecName: Full=Cytochrome c-type biogenesis protein CcmE; AltName: Full=Cytochrome c maturation protein E; AltName: Full=Heme chaperone CcmE [Rickettsia typhi str. Wilmington]AAU04042.1 cytochrome c-type biogenesis protein CcmE [Rickettsia typhi str. Wilmington]AFE54421.1 cytochrome c-type biogenesis protein CcmE [Rickettsia typhi str. TH1527]AFE55259.1 cytochrome c-type biogenesis protein CcmE [Rickettsia typhi str. B9991CWPP]
MQKIVRNRLIKIILCFCSTCLGISIILYNLEKNIIFFFPPSKINEAEQGKELRVGGLVKRDSINRISANKISFVITDNIKDLEILYQGVLPALFREGQGIIAIGQLSDNKFIARQLLAKHDENYRPPS